MPLTRGRGIRSGSKAKSKNNVDISVHLESLTTALEGISKRMDVLETARSNVTDNAAVPENFYDAVEMQGQAGQGGDSDMLTRQEQQLLSAGEQLDKLFINNNNTGTGDITSKPKATGYSPMSLPAADPRQILTVKASSHKATHITTFLSEQAKKRLRQNRQRNFILSKSQGDNIVLRSEEDHPYIGISIAEWSAANCRLMAHLLQTGELERCSVEYYLAYTTQIMEYAERYAWNAVLDFDYTYRERQAEHGFMWGTIPPNMEICLLGHPRPSKWSQPPNHTPTKQPNKQVECKLFKLKNGACPFGDACKFFHPPNAGQPKNAMDSN